MAFSAPISALQMNWEAADPIEAFRKFKQKCELMFKSILKDVTKEEQASYLLLWVGEEGLDMYNSWTFEDERDRKDPARILERFMGHLEPRTNHRIHRYTLQGVRQEQGESVDNFVSKIKNTAAKCKFRDAKELEDRIVDQLVWGSNNPEVQKALIGRDETLTLSVVRDIARSYEATKRQMSSLLNRNVGQTRVDAISQKKPGLNKRDLKSIQCKQCGKTHNLPHKDNCPAHGTKCRKCGKLNHWQSVCRSVNVRPRSKSPFNRRNRKQIDIVETESIGDSGDIMTIGTIEINNVQSHNTDTREEVFTTLRVTDRANERDVNLKCKVDTGAQSNVLPIRLFRILYPELIDANGMPKEGVLQSNEMVLTTYGGAHIKQLGTINIACQHKGRNLNCIFYVTDASGPAILGMKACRALNLVSLHCALETKAMSSNKVHRDGTPDSNKGGVISSRKKEVRFADQAGIVNQRLGKDMENCINSSMPMESRPGIRNKEHLIEMYPECFDGTVGCFGDYTYHITLDPKVKPVVHAARRVPLELMDRLNTELAEMEKVGVIEKVTKPTDWVNSLVIREKPNGRLRLCLDPKDLNEAIKRDHYPTPTLEEITPKLAGAKLFSKLDARNGYWNVKLDEESSYLTTFNTPNGRYRFLRMPFGLRMSQDVFQFKIDETYRNCPGAAGIADDITVHGKDERNHDLHLHEAMECTRKAGIKLNKEKCVVKTTECSFFGMLYTPDGVKPDAEKVRAIQNLEQPKDKQELHTFLGFINYMAPFMPNLADYTAPLRELLKTNLEYIWTPSHTRAFETLKCQISTETTLAYYDRNKPVILQVDASNKGLGATLIQDGKPIAFASKALTPAESRYANIERELLAIVYGCEKFHTYLYGREFVVESDHRPLEQIHKKNLSMAPPRLQRMLLRLQPYDCTVKYKPSKEMVVADALSRLSSQDKQEIPGMEVKVHHLVQITPVKLKQVQEETAKDGTLQILSQQVIQGWPDSIKKVQAVIRPYWTNRDDISIQEGVLLFGSRIIIPESLREMIMKEIHTGHLGMEKCKLRSKSCVYWPGIYKEIENTVASCTACKKFQNCQQKESMIPSEIPPRPWHTLSADLFKVDQSWYIVIADYYSKFPFVKKLNNITAAAVVNVTRTILSEQGIPEVLICDNGTQFTSAEFQSLAKRYGFKVVTSSPYYPRGHGFIERQVQTVKKILLKCRESGDDPNLALLTLRATPLSARLRSPAELLNGRMFRTTLPVKVNPPDDQEETRQLLSTQQEKQVSWYDRNSKEMPMLFQDQPVQIQDPVKKTWSSAKIVNVEQTPRSYVIENEMGVQLRRNRSHIKSDVQKTARVMTSSVMTENQNPMETENQNPMETAVEPSADKFEIRTRSGRLSKKPDRFTL